MNQRSRAGRPTPRSSGYVELPRSVELRDGCLTESSNQWLEQTRSALAPGFAGST